MINFECPNCGNNFEVSDDNAGLRGKCPRCKEIFRVPEKSISEFEILKDAIFKNKNMNELYQSFLKKHDKLIIRQRVSTIDDIEYANLVLKTNPGRSQFVTLGLIEIDKKAYLNIYSRIGIINYTESAVNALRMVGLFSTYTLSLDKDNTLLLSSTRKLKNYDDEEFAGVLINLAFRADEMEESIFSGDIN